MSDSDPKKSKSEEVEGVEFGSQQHIDAYSLKLKEEKIIKGRGYVEEFKRLEVERSKFITQENFYRDSTNDNSAEVQKYRNLHDVNLEKQEQLASIISQELYESLQTENGLQNDLY